ncbi:MAG: hypothetical protein EHM72_01085 [Calditrichaeota bacterium]|nr:MAG: hypothetical protein EHM72_01085 [Calditrichota bacterium]
MIAEIILVSLWGGMVALDTTAVLQVMISRPLVACTTAGLILGNLPLGLTMGILLELLYVSELPVGAAPFAEGNVGSTAAATVAVLTARAAPERTAAVIVISLLLAVMISILGGQLVNLMRRMNTHLYTRLSNRRQLKPRHINFAQAGGILMAFLIGFVCVMAASLLFPPLLPLLIALIPINYDKILQPTMGGLLGAGCVFLVHMFWSQTRNKWLLLFGFGIGLIIIYLRVL